MSPYYNINVTSILFEKTLLTYNNINYKVPNKVITQNLDYESVINFVFKISLMLIVLYCIQPLQDIIDF